MLVFRGGVEERGGREGLRRVGGGREGHTKPSGRLVQSRMVVCFVLLRFFAIEVSFFLVVDPFAESSYHLALLSLLF